VEKRVGIAFIGVTLAALRWVHQQYFDNAIAGLVVATS